MEKRTFKVIMILALQQGVSERGNWQSQQIIVESTEPVQYPDQLLLSFSNAHVDKLKGIQVGMEVTVHYSAYVRKYQGKDGNDYYTQQLNCWKIEEVVKTF